MPSETTQQSSPPKDSEFQYIGKIFALPPPIKYLFDRVPLLTYNPNTLPARAPKPNKKQPRLYIFSTPQDVAAGRPSFNPTCLKWQTFLKIASISFELVPSNNHASPSGILPFLIPAYSTSENEKIEPIPAIKLRKYVDDVGKKVGETDSPRFEAYQSLIDNSIRKAWLYALYLSPENSHIPLRFYINPTTSSSLVRKSLSHTLSAAAKAELVSATSTNASSLSIFGGHTQEIDVGNVFKGAAEAFEALDVLLGDHEWFFGLMEPGEFDAAVFAYTHLLLDEKMGWRDRRLVQIIEGCGNLVGHRGRILETYYEVVYE